MQFHYTKINALPPLVWFAEINDGKVDILHGPHVEASDTWFVEGAWSGDFSAGDFLRSNWFCGTGGIISDDSVIFSTPTHVIGGLFMVKNNSGGGGYGVSNSLYFLMYKSGLHLDDQYLKYETDFNSITRGINKYNSDIRALDINGKPHVVHVYYYRNIEIDNHNQCTISVKNKTFPFADFEDYETRLVSDMSSMYQNARDKSRNYKYGIVTMVSKGYDAPCCATIVKKIGGNTALTFKPEERYAEDSGVEIAQRLGYKNIIERSAFEYKNREDMPEIEYLSSGELGAEISFSVFENDFKGNLVFTGERGDSIYDRLSKHRNEEFHVINMQSGLSNVERRLWHSYIPVPMPLYGATAWPSLYEIANSQQMANWQMNNKYDRPIPRRIVETAGIPRKSFGVEKRGAGFSYHYDWMGRILNRMSSKSAADFSKFVRAKRKPHPIQFISFIVETYGIYLGRLGIKNKDADIEKLSSLSNPMAARYLIPWAGEHMIKRYKKILER